MLSFRQYLEESLNKPYRIKFHDKDEDGYGTTTHEYHFQDHNGDNHRIYFNHHEDLPHEAEMSFTSPTGSYRETGKQGHHAIRMFATMKSAIEKHAKKNPKLKSIKFTSDKEAENSYKFKEGSRNKLYRRFTDMAGGKTTDDEDVLTHKIPVNQEKK